MDEHLNKLRYMIGIHFDAEDARRAIYGFKSWYIKFSFYWFSLAFFKRWHPDMRYGRGRLCAWTGFVFYYRPNPDLKEGELIWLKCKKWTWPDYPKATMNPLDR